MKRRGSGSIDPAKLVALMGATIDARENAKEITDEVKRDVREAVESHGLHARAFSMCVAISKLDQVKRLALLQAFDSYRHILALDDAPQEELLPDPPTQMREPAHG
jgi:uncharacterized protein (UPF0335 family)